MFDEVLGRPADVVQREAELAAQRADDLEWLDREIADAEQAAIFSPIRWAGDAGTREDDAADRMAAGERALRLRRLRAALR